MTKIKVDKIEKLIFKEAGSTQEEDIQHFINSAKRYIAASRQHRIMASIGSVSKSGMSRTIRFTELGKSKYDGQHYIMTFCSLFNELGYREIKDSGYFRITGCGMGMVFHTHYQIIHQLHSLGFMTKPQRDKLCQKTPHVI